MPREYLRELTKALLLLVLMIVIIIVSISVLPRIPDWWKQKELERQRAIVNELSPLIDDCKKIGDVSITVYGKCLVWDMAEDCLSDSYIRIPTELRPRFWTRQITLFMVLPPKNQLVGYYSISHQAGYRQYTDVCVATWPEKKPLGMHSIIEEPSLERAVKSTPEYGDFFDDPIADWIEGLPRSR